MTVIRSAQPSSYRPKGIRPPVRVVGRLDTFVQNLGRQLHFTLMAVAGTGRAVRAYRSQTMIAFTDLTWGNGRSVIIGGGVAPVIVIMGVAAGGMIGIVGYSTLSMLGMGPLTGMMSALANTRELAPMIAAIGFAAQAGCRITAEIGAMRVSEEIDALEAQAIRPIPFVVSTRIVAAIISIAPVYVIALALSYLTTWATVTLIHGEAPGGYEHYFDQFVSARDVVFSLIKVVIFVVAVTIAHSYQGFYASGGPEGVGVASGRAVRASLVLVIFLDMLLTIVMWGFSSDISFAG
ncbi:YrbE family protein [Gordonia effusa NBRC 100432]|uniref:YrbE family protein n=1 Tax=Gordonia effusa NBRC 100432 TaxID=1077974 RepID=H0QWG3_9ACTN|nr:ABC transporter permease [Gordonia effusa]GAB17164.1 YrbE family protein [Gordonia effusa NBRC 100432]